MPTAFLCNEDEGVMEPLASGTQEQKAAKEPSTSKPPAKTKATVQSTTKAKKKKPSTITPKATGKTKKAAKTNSVAKGQMTLGAFFGGAAVVAKKAPAPQKPAVSADKMAQLKHVVLGKQPLVCPKKVLNKSQRHSKSKQDGKNTDNNDDSNPHSMTSDGDESPLVETPMLARGESSSQPLPQVSPEDESEEEDRAAAKKQTKNAVESPPGKEGDNQQDKDLVDDANSCCFMDTLIVVDSPLRPPNEQPRDTQNEGAPHDHGNDDTVMKDANEPHKNPTVQLEEKQPDEYGLEKMKVESTVEVEPLNETTTTRGMETEASPETDNDTEKDGKKQTSKRLPLESINEADSRDKSSPDTSQSDDTTLVSKQGETEKDGDLNKSTLADTKPSCETESPKDTSSDVTNTQDAQLVKLQSLYDTYYPQAVTLFAACREGLVDVVPAFDRTLPEQAPSSLQEAKTRLATLIEGRFESLAALATDVAPYLTDYFDTVDAVTEEIKLLAKRQPLVKDHVVTVLEETAKPKSSPNIFQDESLDRFWQWQVTVVDLLPNKNVVKQRRAKIRKEVQYLHNLVAVLQTLKQILKAQMGDRQSLLAKLSRQEEKVLQYQREQERAKLEQQLKESQRLEKEKAKAAKKAAEDAKKKEAAAAKAASKKEAVAAALAAKKEAKAKEAEEKAKKEEEKKQKKQALLHRQQDAMMSFLKKASSSPKKVEQPSPQKPVPPLPQISNEPTNGFDVKAFRSQINSVGHDSIVPFGSPSKSARLSRRRKYRSVELSVYVTVVPDNEWGALPYAELQQVSVRNRNKFLSFREDVRPPYHGTWSKKSHVVNPRNPFKKDRAVFDYDYDSEAEWEEGDNEAGEDIENAADDEEEKDEEEEGDDDGWLAADDDLDDDPDEETKLLRQKVVRQDGDTLERQKSFIVPVDGRPLTSSDHTDKHVEGMSVDEAFQLLSSHTGKVAANVELYLDPFPPTLIEEVVEPASPSDSNDIKITNMQAFLRFVHCNSTGSKEKLVDDIRTKLPDVMNSRAQALRTLEAVADKQKHPIKGFIWEVRREVLDKYDLGDLLEEATLADPETAKQQILRTVASHIHNSTHTSKEKLVDDLQANHSSILVSRAETLRHVEALAEKKKRRGGGVVWAVTDSAQQELGIELAASDADANETRSADSANEGPPSAKKRKLNDQVESKE